MGVLVGVVWVASEAGGGFRELDELELGGLVWEL